MRAWSPYSTRTKQPHTADRTEDNAGTGTKNPALAPHALQAAEKRRAPGADGESAPEEDDGVNADAALAGPVGVRF